MTKTSRAAFALLLVFVAASPAAAQAPAADGWKVTVAPYLLAASINGTTAVKGQEVTVDMSPSDIFKNLQFGAMGFVVARKGAWGVAGDAVWMSLGADGAAPGPLRSTARADMDQGAFAFYGLRRLSQVADLLFGARVNTLQANLQINAPLAVRSAGDSKTWVDPIAGLQLHTPANGKRWHAQAYVEVGGFGAGSTFTWQIFPTVGVDLTEHTAMEFGYRWLDIDYSTGKNTTLFKYDVLTQGPVLGLALRF